MRVNPGDHVRPHIKRLAEKIAKGEREPLQTGEYEVMRMNSYERHWLLPYMSDAVLLEKIRYAQSNARQLDRPDYEPPITYDEALKFHLMNELVARFMEKSKR